MSSRVFRPWQRGVLAGLLLTALNGSPPASVAEELHPIPVADYRIYDAVVRSKFLTSQTTLVLILSVTVIRLLPEQDGPATIAWFSRQGFLGGHLDQGMVSDFLRKNATAVKLEKAFDFGVRYRFLSPDGQEEPEVSLAPIPARLAHPWQAETAPAIIGVLGFSRVGYTARRDQALVYVEVNRADQTGAGFLILLHREGGDWRPADTEVLWMARPDQS